MSLGQVDNRSMPRTGVFAPKLGSRQGDQQKHSLHPLRIFGDGVEVAEELKQKIEPPRKGLLKNEEVEEFLHHIEDEIKQHPDDFKRVQAHKVIELHSLRMEEIRKGGL